MPPNENLAGGGGQSVLSPNMKVVGHLILGRFSDLLQK